jgi:hypothetical protein
MSSGGGAAANPDRGRYADLEEDDEDRAETAEVERLARRADNLKGGFSDDDAADCKVRQEKSAKST